MRLSTIPESVLFRVLSSDDIPFDIGHKVWSRSISLTKHRQRQKSLERRGKPVKFKVTDEEIKQITKNPDEKTDTEIERSKTK